MMSTRTASRRGRRLAAAEERDDGLPRCATCARARVIPDIRPVEWRCRGGHRTGGLVYRGAKGAFSENLITPRECEGYEAMG